MELLLVPLLMLAATGLILVDAAPSSDTSDAESEDNTDDLLKARTLGPGDNDIAGTDGRDLLRLGDGDDVADGMAGDDRLFGQDGADQIAGGAGNDAIFLGDGADQNFIANDGDLDQLAGDDTVRGGDGTDLIFDYVGSNTLYGDEGADVLDATDLSGDEATPDTLFGGQGEDVLAGDAGDHLFGGAERDEFYVRLDAAPDAPAVIHDYQPGEPLEISVPLAFDGQTLQVVSVKGGVDLRLGGETLVRLDGVKDADDVNATIVSSDLADQTVTPGTLKLGSQGDDTLSTGDGDDAVFAGRGADDISTGAGDDYISLRSARPFEAEGTLGWGTNTVDAGEGDDRVLGGFSNDLVRGGAGDDLLLGQGGADDLRGGSGDDFLDGYDDVDDAADTLDGGGGDDRLIVDDGDIATGGKGADAFDAVNYQSGDAPVRITDFEPGFDTLAATVTGSNLAVRFDADGDDTLVKVGNRTVFVLEGLAPDALATTEVALSRNQ